VYEITGLGRGYIGARTDTIQQSGQTPDKEAEMNHIAVYVSGYTSQSDWHIVCQQMPNV